MRMRRLSNEIREFRENREIRERPFGAKCLMTRNKIDGDERNIDR